MSKFFIIVKIVFWQAQLIFISIVYQILSDCEIIRLIIRRIWSKFTAAFIPWICKTLACDRPTLENDFI